MTKLILITFLTRIPHAPKTMPNLKQPLNELKRKPFNNQFLPHTSIFIISSRLSFIRKKNFPKDIPLPHTSLFYTHTDLENQATALRNDFSNKIRDCDSHRLANQHTEKTLWDLTLQSHSKSLFQPNPERTYVKTSFTLLRNSNFKSLFKSIPRKDL
jgi:hypothetical protein